MASFSVMRRNSASTVYNSSMKQDGWGELEEWYPETARDLDNLEHFLALANGGLESRKGRIQKALGVQHFVLSEQVRGLVLLARSGAWLAILPIASSIFRIAMEGIYLSEHPNSVDDFVEFSGYQDHCGCEPPTEDGLYPEIVKVIRDDQKKKFEKLRSGYQNKISWHDHDVETLAQAVEMEYLLPIYYSTSRLAQGSPTRFISNGKGGRLLFDHHREKTTPVMAVGNALLMVCHSACHFYQTVLDEFVVSNEMIHRSLNNFKDGLAKCDSSTA